MDGHLRVRTDWLKRRGTVANCGVNMVYIRWDGLKALDGVPVKGVERIPEDT